jgi:cytochrome c peroxidase
MHIQRIFLKVLAGSRHALKLRPVIIVTVLATLIVAGAAARVGSGIFAIFPDDSGAVQSAPSDLHISTTLGAIVHPQAPLDKSNKFFDPNFGTNGQACVTCHQPSVGFTINVKSIQAAHTATGLMDPLFRLNDTANDPNGASNDANFSLFLGNGVIRIGKTFPAMTNFTVEPQTTAKFGTLPLANDPQQQGSGHATLSLFRRPLVNTNVHLDSSVLWDGRASIGNMRAQASGAAKTLLLATNPSDADADQVVAFMLGVFSDQHSDIISGVDLLGNCLIALCGAGRLDVRGAQGGVSNLIDLAVDSDVPCNTPAAANLLQKHCAPNVPGYSIFDDWVNIDSAQNEAKENEGASEQHKETIEGAPLREVARGQELFNHAKLTVPPDGIPGLSEAPGATIHCTTCHAKGNVGNNPDANFFVRIGTDSIPILTSLGAPGVPLLNHAKDLPEYCLRPVSDPVPFSMAACGTRTGDVKTTDPGRAMVTGDIADVGKFKPPILRDLAPRSPYFHAGVADTIDALVDFYNARFSIGLTPQQHTELTSFIEAQ